MDSIQYVDNVLRRKGCVKGRRSARQTLEEETSRDGGPVPTYTHSMWPTFWTHQWRSQCVRCCNVMECACAIIPKLCVQTPPSQHRNIAGYRHRANEVNRCSEVACIHHGGTPHRHPCLWSQPNSCVHSPSQPKVNFAVSQTLKNTHKKNHHRNRVHAQPHTR